MIQKPGPEVGSPKRYHTSGFNKRGVNQDVSHNGDPTRGVPKRWSPWGSHMVDHPRGFQQWRSSKGFPKGFHKEIPQVGFFKGCPLRGVPQGGHKKRGQTSRVPQGGSLEAGTSCRVTQGCPQRGFPKRVPQWGNQIGDTKVGQPRGSPSETPHVGSTKEVPRRGVRQLVSPRRGHPAVYTKVVQTRGITQGAFLMWVPTRASSNVRPPTG